MISLVQAEHAAWTMQAATSDNDAFDRHLFRIESAAMQVQRSTRDEDGEEAAAAAPGDTLGVDLHDHLEVNPPDRAGESSHVGYDFPGFAEAVADPWWVEFKARIALAVEADEQAPAARPARSVAA